MYINKGEKAVKMSSMQVLKTDRQVQHIKKDMAGNRRNNSSIGSFLAQDFTSSPKPL